LFPEAFVGGYPKGLDFGARIGSRTPAGRESFRVYYEGAINVPGPHTARIGEIAAANSVHLVTGVIERDQGTLYCTVLFYGPEGSLLGKHRKLNADSRRAFGVGLRRRLDVARI
jgi:nitrilase